MPTKFLAKLDAARRELLDLGLRNSLINYQAGAKKVEVVDELSREVHRLLVSTQTLAILDINAGRNMVIQGSYRSPSRTKDFPCLR
jgi:hypothetical protein